MFALRFDDLKTALSSATSLDNPAQYLVNPGKTNGNINKRREAVLIEGWVFPACALEFSRVPENLKYHNVTLNLTKGDRKVGTVQYPINDQKIRYVSPL